MLEVFKVSSYNLHLNWLTKISIDGARAHWSSMLILFLMNITVVREKGKRNRKNNRLYYHFYHW